jgi:hypothetical protein
MCSNTGAKLRFFREQPLSGYAHACLVDADMPVVTFRLPLSGYFAA